MYDPHKIEITKRAPAGKADGKRTKSAWFVWWATVDASWGGHAEQIA